MDHVGIQVDSEEELHALKANATAADMALLDDGQTSCCYSRSDKYWVVDPQGIAWEQFHTLHDIPVFTEAEAGKSAEACCANEVKSVPVQFMKSRPAAEAAKPCC